MKAKFSETELEFLSQSNAIEGVRDKRSLEDAKKAWAFIRDRKRLTVLMILKAHKILMKNQPLLSEEKGAYRRCRVWVGGREGLDWPAIPQVMAMWVNDFKPLSSNLVQEHVSFEKIHPFVDGNGRIGRMIYNWHRLQVGANIHVIHEGMEQYLYYKWFH